MHTKFWTRFFHSNFQALRQTRVTERSLRHTVAKAVFTPSGATLTFGTSRSLHERLLWYTVYDHIPSAKHIKSLPSQLLYATAVRYSLG